MKEPTQPANADISEAWDCAAKVHSLASELEFEAYRFRLAGIVSFANRLSELALTMRSEAKLMAADIPSRA